MPRIPLEDNVTDVIGKAQRGRQLSDAELAVQASLPLADVLAVKSGEIREHALRAIARPLKLGGKALIALARKQWYPEQPVFPRGFAMFNTPFDDLTVNSYLVWDVKTRHAAAFDTGTNCDGILATVQAEKLTLRSIFITHTHDDHIADLPRLARASSCGFMLDETKIPITRGCSLPQALRDGEDFELLFTIAARKAAGLQQKWRRTFPKLPLTEIGSVTQRSTHHFQKSDGHDHFADA